MKLVRDEFSKSTKVTFDFASLPFRVTVPFSGMIAQKTTHGDGFNEGLQGNVSN